MGYAQQGWASRFERMGDDAESEFERWATRSGYTIERLGWNRPKMGVGKMGPLLRHMPDYYASDGYLYEVVGMGRDDVLKGMKVEKWESLKTWNKFQGVRLFVYSSSRHAVVMLPWPALVQIVAQARKAGIKAFKNDGNQYYPIQWEWLEPYKIGETG